MRRAHGIQSTALTLAFAAAGRHRVRRGARVHSRGRACYDAGVPEVGPRVAKWLAIGFVGLVVVFTLYTWFVLTWSYSSGERAGYVQKLSKKGWLCKTWEGEMALVSMPGTVAEKFYFTVPDDAVAQKINQTIGRRVSLTYEQHIGVPTSCFAETEHFITAVHMVEGVESSAPPVLPNAAQ
jgi:hypothetical protein